MISYHTSPLAALGGKHSGGMNVYVRELSLELARRGHQVDIFTRGANDELKEIGNGARLVPLPAGPKGELSIRELPAQIPEFAKNIVAFSERNKLNYDLIHVHYWMSGLAGVELKRTWSLPMVVMFHTLGLVKNRIAATGATESDARIRAERQVMAAADKVVASTPAERADLQWLYELRSEKVEVLSPGVDLQLFRPMAKVEARRSLSIPENEFRLLYVGRIEALKGIDTLIRSVALVGKTVAGLPLRVQIIGGDIEERFESLGTEMDRLRELSNELGLEGQIEFIGSLDQHELPTHYSAADLVVMPSYSESFGMVALEAMACARAVIASRVGGLAFLVRDGETGFHIQEGNPQELAARIKTLLQNPEQLERFGVAARKEAEGYSWGKVSAEIEELYERLLN